MKDMKKTTDLKVFQSSKLTLANYKITGNQKNIVYKILVAIKDDLIQDNLFGDKVIFLEKKYLLKYRQDVKLLKQDLRFIKNCTLEYTKPNGDYVIAGVINDSIIKARVPLVEITINKKFIEFVRHFHNYFTAYSLTVALSLKGVHTKRIYEICCMARDLGKYRFPLLELKKMLGLENKYKMRKSFEKYVLEQAKLEINYTNEAEVIFDYKFEKVNREDFVIFEIKDKKKLENKKSIKAKKENEVGTNGYYYLSRLVNEAVHNLSQIYFDLENNGKLGDFEKKYQGKYQYYSHTLKKPRSEFKKVMLGILKSDFGIDLKNYRYKEKEYKDGAGNVVQNKDPKAAKKELLEFHNKTKNKSNTATNTPPQRLDPNKTVEGVKYENNGQICIKCGTWESAYYHKYRNSDYCTTCYQKLEEYSGGIAAIAAKILKK